MIYRCLSIVALPHRRIIPSIELVQAKNYSLQDTGKSVARVNLLRSVGIRL